MTEGNTYRRFNVEVIRNLAHAEGLATPEDVKERAAWLCAADSAEEPAGSGAAFNPLNIRDPRTHETNPGCISEVRWGPERQANYLSFDCGVAATVRVLRLRYYTEVVDALLKPGMTFTDFRRAWIMSPWAANHYHDGLYFPKHPASDAYCESIVPSTVTSGS